MARILLIDDDDALREMITFALTRAGHQVVEASDGREGTRLFEAEPPELVITDIIMPHQEGIETVIRLHREQPELPIIAMSGSRVDSPLYLEIATRMGAKRTFMKPFELSELLAAIDDLLGK